MVFSSVLFLFYFLPALLFCFLIAPKKKKNVVLLVFSLLFYFIGEPRNVFFLILSSILNYWLGVFITKYPKKAKLFLTLGIGYNVGQLLYFKYTNFFLDTFNEALKINFSFSRIALPIGISFYTFQAISYLVDVYKNPKQKAKNWLFFSTYLTLFAQLVAGPIVRFEEVQKELEQPILSKENFAHGIQRFIFGLSKKVLFANVLGEFLLALKTHTVIASWVRPLAYTLQIYFDFSGYSDMAIGLGLLFGFHFPENFRYPFIATSLTDFWRRWHISLSRWFRDYIYIPLGGNRKGKGKWVRNILIVWALTGFWHGASWNFLIWGLYFGVLLLLEKSFLEKFLQKRKIFAHFYTIFFVLLSFLIFSTENLASLILSFKEMFFLKMIPFIDKLTFFYIKDYAFFILFAILCSTPFFAFLYRKISKTKIYKRLSFLEPCFLILLFLLDLSFLIDASFNPFLYFRF